MTGLGEWGSFYVIVGAPEKPLVVAAFGLLLGRRNLSGSRI
jgi:hypothetical protein